MTVSEMTPEQIQATSGTELKNNIYALHPLWVQSFFVNKYLKYLKK